MVTAYAARDQAIDFIACFDFSVSRSGDADNNDSGSGESASKDTSNGPNLRILFGAAPYLAASQSYPLGRSDLPEEIAAYWLHRGISLTRGAKLVLPIEYLRQGRVEMRYGGTAERPLHAKIYLGEEAATLDSSNFSHTGLNRFSHTRLNRHYEANARFRRGRDAARYRALKTIAEHFWEQGRAYGAELNALLEPLFRTTAWREALAFAGHEILEGEFVESFLQPGFADEAPDLWPAQRQGIAQALYILANQGSVLVADETGSGKTRVGANPAGAKLQEIIAGNRLRRGRGLVVCPPAVRDNWLKESLDAGVGLDIYSHGSLSSRRPRSHELAAESLRRAQF